MAQFAYKDPREAAMGRLANLSFQRQAFTDEQYALAQKQMAQQEASAHANAVEPSRNWLNSTATGAMAGGAIGGPWGALIGGGAGLVAGLAGGTASRMKGGPGERRQGFFKALGNTAIRPVGRWDGASDIPLGAMMGLGATLGGPPGPMTMGAAQASQARGLESWRNASASAGMAGSAGSYGAANMGGLGQAYGAPYPMPENPLLPLPPVPLVTPDPGMAALQRKGPPGR